MPFFAAGLSFPAKARYNEYELTLWSHNYETNRHHAGPVLHRKMLADRCAAGALRHGAGVRRAADGRPLGAHRCLLYTSDAADD